MNHVVFQQKVYFAIGTDSRYNTLQSIYVRRFSSQPVKYTHVIIQFNIVSVPAACSIPIPKTNPILQATIKYNIIIK